MLGFTNIQFNVLQIELHIVVDIVMTRKLVLLGALSFFVGIGVIVASFVISPAPIVASKNLENTLSCKTNYPRSFSAVIQVVGALLILISFILVGWHVCGGKNKAPKKVLKSKNRSKRPKEISRSNYG